MSEVKDRLGIESSYRHALIKVASFVLHSLVLSKLLEDVRVLDITSSSFSHHGEQEIPLTIS